MLSPALTPRLAGATPAAPPARAGRSSLLDGPPRIVEPVFVVCPPRSGSSLLFETLQRSPSLATIGGESHEVIEGIAALAPAQHDWGSNRLDADRRDVGVVAHLKERFAARMRDRDGRPSRGPTRLLEKTPKNALRIPFLARAFPDARFVFLYRDPRETVSSMLDAWRSERFVTYRDLPGLGRPAVVAAAHPRVARPRRATARRARVPPVGHHRRRHARRPRRPRRRPVVRGVVRPARGRPVGGDPAPVRVPRHRVGRRARRAAPALAPHPRLAAPRQVAPQRRRARAVRRRPDRAGREPRARRVRPGAAHRSGADRRLRRPPPHRPSLARPATRPGPAAGLRCRRTESRPSRSCSARSTPVRSARCSTPPVRRSLVTTYQAGRVVMVRDAGDSLNSHFRALPTPMGVAYNGRDLAIGTQSEIMVFQNQPALAARLDPPDRHDGCFVVRTRHSTGDIRVHDLAWGADGLWVVNTRFSCLATLDAQHSFVPRWRPPFVSALAAEDRCHLNGLAIVDGQPKFVTVLGTTDEAGGWREHKADGGAVLDVPSGEIVDRGAVDAALAALARRSALGARVGARHAHGRRSRNRCARRRRRGARLRARARVRRPVRADRPLTRARAHLRRPAAHAGPHRAAAVRRVDRRHRRPARSSAASPSPAWCRRSSRSHCCAGCATRSSSNRARRSATPRSCSPTTPCATSRRPPERTPRTFPCRGPMGSR